MTSGHILTITVKLGISFQSHPFPLKVYAYTFDYSIDTTLLRA
ncbi:protein of unknown function [Limnospira indica PCC 8005]|uniref:Uncharacterized protein n=1 Tax=Limnospira indica PCC 8005 TaxID=376219 RepID=A0A9P1NWY1_9CYAN|nr:protein of unknown function [Limnospira indica PCC 8005]